MSTTFEARYRSECRNCGYDIKPGELATYVPRVDDENAHPWRRGGSNVAVHATCPQERPAGEVCGRCFMEKSATGVCGCD